MTPQASPVISQPPGGFLHRRTDSQDSEGLYATSLPPQRSASQGSEGLYSPVKGAPPLARRTDSQGSEGLLYSPVGRPQSRRTDSQV